ncbi:uncharacterized protein G2W53_034095 [Senna tora]|uniref:Uncharacterized protein n=1 Tax=Senna tora TaxID=362788 RepID=A0A834TAG8_9FABA|nr:uncharacterized protein G2W53_034095 [Senna tora]
MGSTRWDPELRERGPCFDRSIAHVYLVRG